MEAKMLRLPGLVGAAIVFWLAADDVMAQSNGYVVQPTGRPPTSMKHSTADNDLLIEIPGRPPVHAKPKFDGTYTIEIPGRPPKDMISRPGGGFVIPNPGRPPTYFDPAR
jgi:hypothetical protein